MSKSCAKIIAFAFITKIVGESGICSRQNYIIRSFTICAPPQIFEMMMLERVACMERMINEHSTADSKGNSTRNI